VHLFVRVDKYFYSIERDTFVANNKVWISDTLIDTIVYCAISTVQPIAVRLTRTLRVAVIRFSIIHRSSCPAPALIEVRSFTGIRNISTAEFILSMVRALITDYDII
jgi:hypothetical protein